MCIHIVKPCWFTFLLQEPGLWWPGSILHDGQAHMDPVGLVGSLFNCISIQCIDMHPHTQGLACVCLCKQKLLQCPSVGTDFDVYVFKFLLLCLFVLAPMPKRRDRLRCVCFRICFIFVCSFWSHCPGVGTDFAVYVCQICTCLFVHSGPNVQVSGPTLVCLLSGFYIFVCSFRSQCPASNQL